MKPSTDRFTCLNLVSTIDRANNIIVAFDNLDLFRSERGYVEANIKYIETLRENAQADGDWHADLSLHMAEIEMRERLIRIEDRNMEAARTDYNGGF